MGISLPTWWPITCIARLAETYLLAAEALVMQGKKQEALPYINTIRKRAAQREGLDPAQQAAAGQAMTITDPDISKRRI